MGRASEDGRRPYENLSAEERGRFLEVLRETGNRKVAAAAIGVEARLMDQRRAFDSELDREWEAAVGEADRRLALSSGPFDKAAARGGAVIRRGKSGKLQLVASGEGRWNSEVEGRFLELLRGCGNVRAAARAVGFTESAVWARRRKWAAFARAMEEVLEEAELALEYRIACMGRDVVADPSPVIASGARQSGSEPVDCRVAGAPRNDGWAEPVPFDPDFAMRFLKWREEKRRGRGRYAPRARPPSIESVTEKIIRGVEAIKRHRRREAGEP